MPSIRDLSPVLICLMLASCSTGAGSSGTDSVTSAPAQPSPSARPAVPSDSLTSIPCTASTPQISWPAVTRKRQLLGTFTLDLKQGKKYSGAPTLQPVTTNIANITATSGQQLARSLRGSIMRSLEAKVSLGDLAPVGQSTVGETLGGTYTIAATSSERTFVFFKAVREVTGNWRLRTCRPSPVGGAGRVWSSWSTGNVQTWAGSYEGVLNCATKKTKSSVDRQAQAIGC